MKVAHKVCHIHFFHYLYALKKRVHIRTEAMFGVFAGFAGKVTKKYRILSKRTIKYLSLVAFVLVLTQMVFGVAVPNGALLTSAQQAVAVDSAEQSPAQLTPQTVDSRAARRRAQLQTTESNAAEEDRPIGGDFRSRIDSSNLAPEYGGEAPYQIVAGHHVRSNNQFVLVEP